MLHKKQPSIEYKQHDYNNNKEVSPQKIEELTCEKKTKQLIPFWKSVELNWK